MNSISAVRDGKMAEKTVESREKRSLLHILSSMYCPPGRPRPDCGGHGKIVAEQVKRR